MTVHSACSLNQQSADKHVVPVVHIILIPSSQQVLSLNPYCCVLTGDATKNNYIVFEVTLGVRTHDLRHTRVDINIISSLKLTSSRHDIAENVLIGVKQQSITH
jgi:hypothetical protein